MHNAADRTDYWDAKAEGYLARLQQKQSDLLLETLAESGAIPEAGTVLDVCCGPGWHLSQLADRISRGLGVDSSPGMIAQARSAAIAAGIDNVEFQQLDWQREPISQEKFDLVIASKCPAVRTPEDVLRLQELSRGWCVNTSPVYRRIDVLDVLLERMDINAKQDPHGGAQKMADKLVALWQSGAAPELRYEGGEFVTSMDRETVHRELQVHASMYGNELFEAADSYFNERGGEIIDVTVTMRFVLAIWQVPGFKQ